MKQSVQKKRNHGYSDGTLLRYSKKMSKHHIPKVSIIIPVYKVEDYIEDCICSVMGQTYQDIEIILVDDKGGDRSIDIAKNLLSKSSLIWKVIKHEFNRGLSASRNTGVLHAHGKYLYFIDSDDYLSDNCLELLVSKAEANDAEMTFGNYLEVNNGKMSNGYRTRLYEFIPNTTPIIAYINRHYAPTAWNRLILKSWYDSTHVQFIEGILHEDEPWSLSLAIRCSNCAYINDITYFYRIRRGSIMTTDANNADKIKGRIAFFVSSIKEIQKHAHKLPDCFFVWFNVRLWQELGVCISDVLHNKDFIRQILECAWIPRLSIANDMPNDEMRYYFLTRNFLPNLKALWLAGKLSAAKGKLVRLINRILNRYSEY